MVAYRSFTNNNLTDGGANRDFGEVVAQGGSTVFQPSVPFPIQTLIFSKLSPAESENFKRFTFT